MIRFTILILTILILTPYHFSISYAREDSMPQQAKNKSEHQNRLARASSPYLQAHAGNPVDWYEWGVDAFDRARTEDKPIFLSIGYNACHWCHVMEHESFENEEIAALLNQYFISIKVDREERPDIDQIYMSALQAMTGSGGWPMSIFMTPDGKPFFSGTYFPPEDTFGRPGFKRVITELAMGYANQKDDIVKSAESIYDHLKQNAEADLPIRTIDDQVMHSAGMQLMANFDARYGGFGIAPKFPRTSDISLLFRLGQTPGNHAYIEAALFTLKKMAEGGIYDQLGGGFHRYSVDEKWLVPHFEKMLYDNALLAMSYLEAYQVSGDSFYVNIADGILHYLQNEMTDPTGGIYSTQDADSEGEEGLYYTWKKSEVDEILGVESDWFCRHFDITESGNFEGRSILNIGPHSQDTRNSLNLHGIHFDKKLTDLKNKLLAQRHRRIPPVTDDKILASWNGLAISAFSRAYQVTGHIDYLETARNAADFILADLCENGKLYHSWRQGKLLKTELLEDYAYFVTGLIDLYQASFNESYLTTAHKLATRAIDIFSRKNVFYTTADYDSDLIIRPRDLIDGATPSPPSIMILNLARLAGLTGDADLKKQANAFLQAISGVAARVPQASATLMMAAQFINSPPVEVVLVARERRQIEEFNREIFARFIPNLIMAGSLNGHVSDLPLLQGRQGAPAPTCYVCRNEVCGLPVSEQSDLAVELDSVLSPKEGKTP